MGRLHLALLIAGLAAATGLATAAETAATDGPVTHVVLCWLKQPGDAEGRAAIIAASKALAAIPGVEDLRVGEAVASERAIVDASFDVGLTMRFADTDALAAYLVHPDHVAAVETVLKPAVTRILVYDIAER